MFIPSYWVFGYLQSRSLVKASLSARVSRVSARASPHAHSSSLASLFARKSARAWSKLKY